MQAKSTLVVLQTTKWIVIPLMVLLGLAPMALGQGPTVAADSLVKLVERGDLAALQTRLSSGTNPNQSDDSVVKGWTPLMAAAFSGNVDAARLLLESGALIDARTEFGKTALDVATAGGKTEMAKFLRSRGAKGTGPLEAQAPPARPRPTGDSSTQAVAALAASKIGDAARNGDLAKVRTLLNSDPNLVFSGNKNGATPLWMAAYAGHKDVAELLLAKGAQVDGKTSDGSTPLDGAAYMGHKEVAELLLARGAQVNAKTSNGQTPLFEAALMGHKDVAELLLDKGADANAKRSDGVTPLYIAEGKGYKDVAELLLARGADVNANTSNGVTPLYIAVGKGHKDVAELMLAKGAGVNTKTSDGETPLYLAAVRGYNEIAELLLAKGADANAKTNDGYTPLHAAAEHGFTAVVELLLANSADANAKSNNGLTPLDMAEAQGQKAGVELLRQRGGRNGTTAGATSTGASDVGNVDAGRLTIYDAARSGDLAQVRTLLQANPDLVRSTDNKGGMPLHYAAIEGHRDVVEFLLANKADVNAKANDGETPLYLAALYGHRDVAKLLLANKADVNARDNHGQTPLFAAALYDRKDIAELLIISRADVNAKTDNGMTALHAAAGAQSLRGNISGVSIGQIDVIRVLLANKADPSLEDKYGVSPLGSAFLAGNVTGAREIANSIGYEVLSLGEDRIINDKDWQEVFHCGEPPSVGMSLNVGTPPMPVVISDKGMNVSVSGNMRMTGFSGVVKIGKVLLRGKSEYVYSGNNTNISAIRVKSGALIAYPSPRPIPHPKPATTVKPGAGA